MNADGSRAGEVVWNDTPYMGGVVTNLVGTGGPSFGLRGMLGVPVRVHRRAS